MSTAALVCKIALGVGTVTLQPGIIQTPRYDGAEVRLEFDGARLADIRVNGPYDKDFSYVAHGLQLSSTRLADRVLIEARGEGLDAVRESMILTDLGQLIWTQLSNGDELRASSASLFVGQCEPAE